MEDITRRGFLSAAGGAIAATLLSACGKKDEQPAAEEAVEEQPAAEETAEEQAAADASGFVLLSDAVPDAIQEIRYFSTYNFVGERIDGYEQPIEIGRAHV